MPLVELLELKLTWICITGPNQTQFMICSGAGKCRVGFSGCPVGEYTRSMTLTKIKNELYHLRPVEATISAPLASSDVFRYPFLIVAKILKYVRTVLAPPPQYMRAITCYHRNRVRAFD